MSTRGCVAIGTPSKWRGVYNHWDSYPTVLGREIWQHLRSLLNNGKTLQDFGRELLNYDDWRAYLRKGICEYCGKRTTQPHSIEGVIFSPRPGEKFKTQDQMRRYYCSLPSWRGRDLEIETVIKTEWRIRANIERTGYPDPYARHHQHETSPVEELQITSENPDPLFIEWVYIIEPHSETFHVLSHAGQTKPKGKSLLGESCHRDSNGRWDYGHCVYWHEQFGFFHICGPEPDWEALEAKAR